MKKFLFFLVIVLCILVVFTGCKKAAKGKGQTITIWSFAANNIEEWKERQADIEEKFTELFG